MCIDVFFSFVYLLSPYSLWNCIFDLLMNKSVYMNWIPIVLPCRGHEGAYDMLGRRCDQSAWSIHWTPLGRHVKYLCPFILGWVSHRHPIVTSCESLIMTDGWESATYVLRWRTVGWSIHNPFDEIHWLLLSISCNDTFASRCCQNDREKKKSCHASFIYDDGVWKLNLWVTFDAQASHLLLMQQCRLQTSCAYFFFYSGCRS